MYQITFQRNLRNVLSNCLSQYLPSTLKTNKKGHSENVSSWYFRYKVRNKVSLGYQTSDLIKTELVEEGESRGPNISQTIRLGIESSISSTLARQMVVRGRAFFCFSFRFQNSFFLCASRSSASKEESWRRDSIPHPPS